MRRLVSFQGNVVTLNPDLTVKLGRPTVSDHLHDIDVSEAWAIAEEQARRHLESFITNPSVPVLSDRYQEAPHCWMFLRIRILMRLLGLFLGRNGRTSLADGGRLARSQTFPTILRNFKLTSRKCLTTSNDVANKPSGADRRSCQWDSTDDLSRISRGTPKQPVYRWPHQTIRFYRLGSIIISSHRASKHTETPPLAQDSTPERSHTKSEPTENE